MTEQNRRADDKRAPGELQWGESAAPASADNPSTASAASIDTPEFRKIYHQQPFGALVAYIDARLAAPVAQSTAGAASIKNPYTDYRAQFWQAGFDGGEIDAAMRGHALAAYSEGISTREALAAPAAQAPTPTAAEVRDLALEEAAEVVIKRTRVARDLLGPATPAMKSMAAHGETLAAAIRALRTASKEGGE